LTSDMRKMNRNKGSHPNNDCYLELERPLRFLCAKEIGMIDEFLSAIDNHGELRLVVHKGRLRFVTRTQDFELSEGENEGGST
jgi:hypothetical protein